MVVEKIKCLGVQIDQNLEWKEHIRYISSTFAIAIGFLQCTKNYILRTCLKCLCSQIFVLAFLRLLQYSAFVDPNDTKL